MQQVPDLAIWRAVYCRAADGACGTMLPKSGLQCDMLQDTHCPNSTPLNLSHWPQMQDIRCLLVKALHKLQVQVGVLTVSLCMQEKISKGVKAARARKEASLTLVSKAQS